MAKLWNEKFSDLSSKLDDLSKKAADAEPEALPDASTEA